MIHHGGNTWRDRGKPRTYRTDPTCKDKPRYQDEVTVRAAGAVSLEERKNREQLWCYRCRHCRGWHLTSKNQGKRWEITVENPAPHAGRHA
jgi:hypothetical protein